MNSIRIPAEWEPHRAYWLAFPHIAEEWSGALETAQLEHGALCRAIADMGGEDVRVLVRNAAVEARARECIGKNDRVEYVQLAYGDSWTRDTMPLFGVDELKRLHAINFKFNGWGEKYLMDGDERVQQEAEDWLDIPPAQRHAVPLIFEGGGIELNGAGIAMTTDSCVLNKNRNPGLTRADVNALFEKHLGVTETLWIKEGLPFDHTDGHIDMIARFVDEKTLVYALPHGRILDVAFVDRCLALGIRCVTLPSAMPRQHAGQTIAASYTNFVIANRAVIVPQYGTGTDAQAVSILRDCFPGRAVIGLSTVELIKGGGSFHCMTMQEPSVS